MKSIYFQNIYKNDILCTYTFMLATYVLLPFLIKYKYISCIIYSYNIIPDNSINIEAFKKVINFSFSNPK